MKSFVQPEEPASASSIYAQPGASRQEIAGIHDGRLKIKITARALDGAANKALIQFSLASSALVNPV